MADLVLAYMCLGMALAACDFVLDYRLIRTEFARDVAKGELPRWLCVFAYSVAFTVALWAHTLLWPAHLSRFLRRKI